MFAGEGSQQSHHKDEALAIEAKSLIEFQLQETQFKDVGTPVLPLYMGYTSLPNTEWFQPSSTITIIKAAQSA